VFYSVNLSGAKFSQVGTRAADEFSESKVDLIEYEDADQTNRRFNKVSLLARNLAIVLFKG